MSITSQSPVTTWLSTDVVERTASWQAVQRCHDVVEVRTFDPGQRSEPPAGHALVRISAAGICGADIRVVTGNKASTGDVERPTTLGHEAVGVIEQIDTNAETLRPGDRVVVLPHLLSTQQVELAGDRVDPRRIGAGHTLHMGWDIDGVFADYTVVPTTHLVRVAEEYLEQAEMFAPELGEAVFAFTEPMLCTLSAYDLARQAERMLNYPLLQPGGSALVLGCGPIGILHAVALRDLGYDVTLHDPATERLRFARWCLGFGRPLENLPNQQFDLVMATSSSADAIRNGERQVRDGGLLYLFAGLNTSERDAMDGTRTFYYERVHRIAQPIVTSIDVDGRNKRIVYLGHSGYRDQLAPQAIATVAAHAAALGRAITGVIPDWNSPTLLDRHGHTPDWSTPDGSPALVAVLHGDAIRTQHIKTIICPGHH